MALASEGARPFVYRDGRLCCGGVGLTEVAEEFGTPLYVYSADQIRHRLGLFQGAFGGRAHTICYAVKANSALAILRMLAAEGAGFDIVSGGELERVRRADEEALGRVVFSGVGKQVEEIDAALRAGILLFNVESEAELWLLAERAEALGVRARFALRVNPDVFAETHPYISTGLSDHKFGIAIGEARGIYRKAKEFRWLDAAGVSVHIGSQIRAVEPFRAALERVLALVGELRADGHEIRYVDAGGGLGIDYGVGAVEGFDPAAQVELYAEALEGALKGEEAHLLLEPGRFLVGQAGCLLTRVLFVKRNGAKTFVVTDAGMNDLIRPSLYQAWHEIVPVVEGVGEAMKVDVVGPVCESGDFFARDRVMGKVETGELVAILDAGAYGMSLASNYNTRGRAAEVLVEGDGVRLVRRRETVEDMVGAEILG
jgi:diaminopimelate decarboxylase